MNHTDMDIIGSKHKGDSADGNDDAASELLKHDLEWKEFFGSSLSLSAGLSSIYDKIIRGVDAFPYIADDSFTKSEINRLLIVENDIGGNSVELKTYQIDCCDDNECSFIHSRSAVKETSSLPMQMILETDNLDITRSEMDVVRKGSDDGVVDSTGYCLSLPSSAFPDTDDRKRPLSVTSTSSSTSSSSLPRHIRKRIANMSSSLATGSLTADAGVTNASCEMLSTVAECCSPGDVQCSNARSGFFYDDSDKDKGSKGDRRVDEIPVSSSSRQCNSQSIADEYLAASDTEESTESSERNGYDCFEGSKLLTGVAYIERVVVEILETERNYVKDLSDLVQGYVYQIRNDTELEFSGSDVDALFGNIETIWQFNRYFLSRLEECGYDPIKIAECFVSEISGFEIYSTFCTNYPRSMETLMKMMKDEKVAEFLRKQQMLLQHALPLGSYLLKPVQRILKYHILLQNIFNNHDMSEEGHGVIEKALDSMMNVATHINEMKRQHERALRLQEIQCHLCEWDGTDLMTLGNLILEERFRVCGAKGLRRLFLFEKAVVLTKERDNGMLIMKRFIMFSNLMVIESVPKEPLSFQLIPYNAPREQVTLQASSIEQKRFWCQWLKKLMLDNYGPKIPDKAKELVMMLGKSREEENFESSNIEIPELVKKQHNAPAYLEKRRGRRKSAGFIHDLKLRPKKGMKGGLSTSDTSKLKQDGNKCDAGSSVDALQATDDEDSFGVGCGDDDDKVGSESGSHGNCSCVRETSASDFYKRDCHNFSSESSCSPATTPNGKTQEKNGFDPASFSGHSPGVGPKVGDVQSVNYGKCGGGGSISENPCRKQFQKIASSHSTASLVKVPECIAGPYGGSFYRSNSAGGELHRSVDDWIDESANDKVSQAETIESGEYQLKWYRSLRKPASSSGMLCRKSVSGSVGSRLLEESSIDGSKAIDGRCKTSTRTITSSSSCTKLPSEGYVDPDQAVHTQTLQDRHQHASKTSGRSPRTNLDQKFSKSLKSNLAKKMLASGRCDFEDDSENEEDDPLNSVHSALARLTSRIPAENLQPFDSRTAAEACAASNSASPSEVLLKSDDRKGDTRNKLARLLGRSPIGKNKFPSEGSSPTSPSLAEYLKDRHLTIGERMAVSPDQAFDSLFTIASRNPHRRTPLSECKQMFDRLQTESKEAVAGVPEPACESSATQQYEVKVLQVKQEEKDSASTGTTVNGIEGGGSDSEFYYENKLLEDLGDGFKNDDYEEEDGQSSSDVRSDDDVGSRALSASPAKKSTTAPPLPARMTIKETLHSIERRSNARPVRRVEVQLGEKAQGMREIMQALENVGKNGHETSSTSSFYGKLVHRTVRDRTRELAVCAAITRLRQNNSDAVNIESLAVDKDCNNQLQTNADKRSSEVTMAESLQPETRTSRL